MSGVAVTTDRAQTLLYSDSYLDETLAFVVPDDVKGFAPAVLRHRLVLSPDAELEGTTSDDVIIGILNEAPVPKAVG